MKIINATDEELALCAQKGSRESFAELVRRYRARLLFIIRGYTSNLEDAEDLVQDTFVKAYRNLQKYRSDFKFSTWLFTIARRLAISHYYYVKKFQNVKHVSTNDNIIYAKVPSEHSSKNLWALAKELPKHQFQVLWFKYSEDMSIKEISRIMGKSQVNIKTLLYRARKKIAEQLKSLENNEIKKSNN